MAQKTIGYFPRSIALNGKEVIDAFLKSCKQVGLLPIENGMDCDYAVIWSVLWSGRLTSNQRVYEHYKHHDKPVIVIDVGALSRGNTWKVAVNNINALGYYGHTENLDPDRPAQLGLTLAPAQTNNNGKVCIAMQHRSSEQVKGIDIENWVVKTFYNLREYTDRPVIIRPHPRCQVNMDKLPHDVVVEMPKKVTGTYDSFDLCHNWYALINYNSGPGIQGAIAGCPIIVNETSLAYPVSMELRDLAMPYKVNREQWFIEIAHTEYTVDEIRAGLWYKRLEGVL